MYIKNILGEFQFHLVRLKGVGRYQFFTSTQHFNSI